VEVQPEYPGGEAALSNFVSTSLIYPEMAIDENAEGTVRVQFIVNENGTVSNPKVVGTEIGHGLEQAAIDVIRKMENWTPGKVNGKNVKTRLVLPVVYRIE
jgi:protein TonB